MIGFTMFSIFAVAVISNKADAMAIPGTDENGKQVLVGNVDIYLKNNPYKPPAKKKAPPKKKTVVHRPAPKPVVHKPAPAPIDDTARMRKIAQEEIKKAEEKQKKESKKWKLEEAIGSAVVGAGSAAIAGTVIPGAGTVTGMATGAVGAVAGYTATKIWDNVDDAVGYKYLETTNPK
jgi:hypothetical protein